MQTHDDDSHVSAFLKALKARAAEMSAKQLSQITAGSDGEPVLSSFSSHGVRVQRRPDDSQGILRISIGGGDRLPVRLDYCTYRGDLAPCVLLLEKVLLALKSHSAVA